MSNRHASKQHGLVFKRKPTSKPRKRLNKEKARVRQIEKQKAIKEKIAAHSPSKKTTTAKPKKAPVKQKDAKQESLI